MSDSMKQAWAEVGEEFAALGRTMQARYRAGGEQEEADAEADAAVRDALRRLADAAREAADRLGDIVRDDEVREHAKASMSSFDRAISETVDTVTQRLNRVFTSSKDDDASSGQSPA